MKDKQKILAEIERLKHYGTIPYDRDVFEGVCLIESFINSLPAEQPSEDLEEEISNYIKENFFGSDSMGLLSNRTNGELDCIDVVNIARYFANWQKEQMMKGFCFETKVYQDCDGDDVESPFQTWLSLEQNEITALPSLGLSDGDKVKVIIVKED